MAFFRCFLRHNTLRGFVIVSGKLFATSSLCQSSSRENSPRRQKVHLFGSPAALPEGSSKSSFFRDSKEWKMITFGPYFGVALDNDDNIYIWGQSSNNDYKAPFTAFKLLGLKDIQCSKNDVYLLRSDGAVYVIRDISVLLNHNDDPKLEKVDFQTYIPSSRTPKVINMSVGDSHAAFVTEDGELYCIGNNEYGQCGARPSNIIRESTFLVYQPEDDKSDDEISLNRVTFNEGVKIRNVVCGGRHTICIDDENNIYTFGDDSSVQLFLGDTRGRSLLEQELYKDYFKKHENRNDTSIAYGQKERHLQYNPIKINDVGPIKRFNDLIKKSTITVTAGDDFTIIVLTPKDGDSLGSTVFASGGNKFSQCGSLDVRIHKAQTVKFPKESKITAATCGSNHCLALLESNGLLAWGNNSSGQLIIPKKGCITSPEFVDIHHDHPDELAKGHNLNEIKYMKCAYNNTVIITS